MMMMRIIISCKSLTHLRCCKLKHVQWNEAALPGRLFPTVYYLLRVCFHYPEEVCDEYCPHPLLWLFLTTHTTLILINVSAGNGFLPMTDIQLCFLVIHFVLSFTLLVESDVTWPELHHTGETCHLRQGGENCFCTLLTVT